MTEPALFEITAFSHHGHVFPFGMEIPRNAVRGPVTDDMAAWMQACEIQFFYFFDRAPETARGRYILTFTTLENAVAFKMRFGS